MSLKTRAQIREEFANRGWSITGWSRKNGFCPVMVSDIINDNDASPKRKCLRGESHNIAVALGLKKGEVSRSIPSAVFPMTAAA